MATSQDALEKAEQRAEPGEWSLIITNDIYGSLTSALCGCHVCRAAPVIAIPLAFWRRA